MLEQSEKEEEPFMRFAEFVGAVAWSGGQDQGVLVLTLDELEVSTDLFWVEKFLRLQIYSLTGLIFMGGGLHF